MALALITEKLPLFVGGQLEIEGSDYLYCGEIATAEVEIDSLNLITIMFKWCAAGDGSPVARWRTNMRSMYRTDLNTQTIVRSDEHQIILHSKGAREFALFRPKGYGKLEPSRIEGLVIV